MKMRQKLTIIFSFVFAIFFSVHVNADIIEVSKSQKIEISDFKFEGKGNILSTTDSWKISVSLTNIIPSEVDYCRISAYPPLSEATTDDPYIFIKFYYNETTQKFEGVYNNVDGLRETVYTLRAFSIFFKDGKNIRPGNVDSIYSTKVVINNNCANNIHEVYADSWENYTFSVGDKNCLHKVTQIRRCNICEQIVDTRYLEPTITDWVILKDSGIKVKNVYNAELL